MVYNVACRNHSLVYLAYIRRELEDKCFKLKSAVKEYTSWQTLSPLKALDKVNAVRSSLQQASRTALTLDAPTELSNITFEMPSCNVLSSLEHLGRLKVENRMSTATPTLSTSSDNHNTMVDSDQPPPKKRKEV